MSAAESKDYLSVRSAMKVSWPKCIHRWDAPETCPKCGNVYKQRVINEMDEAHAAALAAKDERIEELEAAGRDCLAALERMYDRDKASAGLRDLRVLNQMRAALLPQPAAREGGSQ